MRAAAPQSFLHPSTLLVLHVLLASAGTSNAGTGSILKRRRRLLIDNSTGPHAFRPGLRYPRNDARMQDGDEVKFYSDPHHSWLALAAAKANSARGSVTMQGGRYHRYCSLTGSRIVCSSHNAGPTHLEIREAGWGGKVGLFAHGKICSDRPEGLTCSQPDPGHISGWEALQMEDAGNGWIAFRGGRDGKYCADDHDGIRCDRHHRDAWETFLVHADSSSGSSQLIQTKDESKAATFVVGRASMTSPEITLKCKDDGNYLSVDPSSKAMTCSSKSPVPLNYHRLDGQKWWKADRGGIQDPSSGKYLKAEAPQYGGGVKANGHDASGWQLFTVELTAGYEEVYPMVRGVNLGSWFLLEKWMVQDLFVGDDGYPLSKCDAPDEYGLMSRLGESTKRSRMEKHWSTWITEDDIRWMAEHGLNTVRVPFGYWMTHPEPPFIDGQLKYMRKLFAWCEKHDIAVLLDFHGLKGSQNGAQTSGNCGACGYRECSGSTWKNYLNHQDTNLAVIERMASEFSSSPAYFGFGIANEVGNFKGHETMAFYQKAYDVIRKHSPDCFIFMDSTFNPSTYPFKGEIHVGQDDHMYYSAKFKGKASGYNMENLEAARGRQLGTEKRWQLLIGEWALDHHGHSLSSYSYDQRAQWTRDFAKAQLQAYEQHSMGWIYWSYKVVPHQSTWNFRHLCEKGWLPGCTAGFDYSPDNWLEHHPCAYAYLDPSHMGSSCPEKVLNI